jgi:sugar phosphate isomerase/epimerase
VIVPSAGRRTGEVHLTYCSNIHPGESWAEVRANLERYVVRVAREVAGDAPFGVGLRLSGLAARELEKPEALAELAAFLAEQRLYLFTINGFPYGTFHGSRVKEEVYLPDWGDAERLAYTDRLSEILAALLPEGVEGTVSSVPCAFRERVRGRGDVARIARALRAHAAHLHRLREQRGRTIALALEPEPCCYLETLEEAVRFFREELFCAAAVRELGELTGLGAGAAEAALRRHLTLCLDTCHAAVEFEDLDAGLALLEREGIRVGKVQLSAGLRIPRAGPDLAALLAPFADPIYLHQVVAAPQTPGGPLRRWCDLPEALRDAGARWPVAAGGTPDGEEWRVHFHVPLFLERFDDAGRLCSTQPFLARVLERQARRPIASHLEVETYTWDVLPEPHRRGDVVSAVARELRWVLAGLGALTAGR